MPVQVTYNFDTAAELILWPEYLQARSSYERVQDPKSSRHKRRASPLAKSYERVTDSKSGQRKGENPRTEGEDTRAVEPKGELQEFVAEFQELPTSFSQNRQASTCLGKGKTQTCMRGRKARSSRSRSQEQRCKVKLAARAEDPGEAKAPERSKSAPAQATQVSKSGEERPTAPSVGTKTACTSRLTTSPETTYQSHGRQPDEKAPEKEANTSLRKAPDTRAQAKVQGSQEQNKGEVVISPKGREPDTQTGCERPNHKVMPGTGKLPARVPVPKTEKAFTSDYIIKACSEKQHQVHYR